MKRECLNLCLYKVIPWRVLPIHSLRENSIYFFHPVIYFSLYFFCCRESWDTVTGSNTPWGYYCKRRQSLLYMRKKKFRVSKSWLNRKYLKYQDDIFLIFDGSKRKMIKWIFFRIFFISFFFFVVDLCLLLYDTSLESENEEKKMRMRVR